VTFVRPTHSMGADVADARDRFVWRWGVLGFGVTLAVVNVVKDEIVQGERLFASAGLSFAVRLLLSLLLMVPLADIA
jgi:hypothetical protein